MSETTYRIYLESFTTAGGRHLAGSATMEELAAAALGAHDARNRRAPDTREELEDRLDAFLEEDEPEDDSDDAPESAREASS